MLRVPVVRLDADLPLPDYARVGDAGADLVAREGARLRRGGGRALVPTGVALALPLMVVISKLLDLYDRDELVLHKSTLDEAPKLFQVATVFTLIIGLAEAPLGIGELGNAQVAIVEFDTRAEIVVDWTDPASAASAYRDKGPDGLRGQTAIGSALATAMAMMRAENCLRMRAM